MMPSQLSLSRSNDLKETSKQQTGTLIKPHKMAASQFAGPSPNGQVAADRPPFERPGVIGARAWRAAACSKVRRAMQARAGGNLIGTRGNERGQGVLGVSLTFSGFGVFFFFGCIFLLLMDRGGQLGCGR